jgi:hypothetical protein
MKDESRQPLQPLEFAIPLLKHALCSSSHNLFANCSAEALVHLALDTDGYAAARARTDHSQVTIARFPGNLIEAHSLFGIPHIECEAC